ncbi:MAG: aspartate ammonia-lyase [Firmicutes bacterium]|nr:aspartate ammonia-lyase [Bacillota bacterium]
MGDGFRLERDSLGTGRVPADAYYGLQTQRAVENFPITGERLHPELIRALALVKKAAALANMEVGLLPPHIGQAIVKAADEVMAGGLADQFVVDPIQGGAGTSINMNMNEVLASRASELLGGRRGDHALVHPNNHVNMSQSTNDAVPTAVRLALLRLIDETEGALTDLAAALEEKAREFRDIVKVGRTHLQDAVPIRLGQEFAAWAAAVRRSRDRLRSTADGLLDVNMGATAVGTGLNADPGYIKVVVAKLAELSGYPLRSAANLVDATQNVDVLVAVSGSLKAAAVVLDKVANDLRLLASGPRAGLHEINLPPVQPGSSIMPGKVNPVMAEVINQVAFRVIGNDLTVTLAAAAGQLELNVMQPVLIYSLIQSITALRNSVRAFTERAVRGITANPQDIREFLDRSVAVVTALSPHLGYDAAAEVAKEALRTGRPVAEIVRERGLLSPEELAVILSPEELTGPGIAGASLRQRQQGDSSPSRS